MVIFPESFCLPKLFVILESGNFLESKYGLKQNNVENENLNTFFRNFSNSYDKIQSKENIMDFKQTFKVNFTV